MTPSDCIGSFFCHSKIESCEDVFYCGNRDMVSARLGKWHNQFRSFGLDANSSIILSAITGELTNNAFDHNIGKWRDHSGCIVGIENCGEYIRLFVADRGQGIISSLKGAIPVVKEAKVILKMAFENRISGRAPEKRGNGLKFVLKHIVNSNARLLAYSQGEVYSIGAVMFDLNSLTPLPSDFGCLILVEWRLP